MPLTLITGPANAGKAELVMDALRRHLALGNEPILVVPTRADGEHYLRELAAERAVLGVRVERFDGLIAEAVSRSGGSAPMFGEHARERLLEHVVRESASGADAPGLARALGSLVAQMQTSRVTPARLLSALRAWAQADGEQSVPVELGEMFLQYTRLLERLGRVDAEQRAVGALDALRREPALWGRSPVLVYGFDDLSPLQLDTIETLAVFVRADVTVSLTYEPGRAAFAGRASAYAALAPLAGEHRSLEARAEHYALPSREPLSHLERSLFEPAAPPVGAGDAVALLEGAGERAELELVAGSVVALLARGVAAEEIAVVLRRTPATDDLLEEVLAAAGAPFALQRTRRLADGALGRALLGLLRCVPGAEGSSEGELADLLAYLRAPGLLEHAELADSLELHARRRGFARADAARAEWERSHWPLAGIEQLQRAQRRGPAALIDRASRELERLFAAPHRGSAPVLSRGERDEARGLAAARRALAELRDLATLAPALAPQSARELAAALGRLTFVGGEAPAPGLVAVHDPLALRARRVRALFLCRLQEGVFPSASRRAQVLSEEERRRLAETSGLLLGEHEDVLAAERYLLYAVASRPEELLVLSSHAAGEDGAPSPHSLFLDDIRDLFDESLKPRRALAEAGGAARREAVAAPPAPIAPLRDGELLKELRERVWSASALERWIRCPVAWFVERMLSPRAIEPDAEPLARGALAHAALRDTLTELRRERGSARLTPASVARARELLDEALERLAPGFTLSVVPERALAVRVRVRADLQRYLDFAAEEASALEPRELELGFGFDEGDERGEGSTLPVARLGGGLALRGRIDRLDVAADGRAVVYDYKGAGVTPVARWARDGDVQIALYMSIAEQLLGLDVAGGLYQPLTGPDLRPRGVLDAQSGVHLGHVLQNDVLEPEEMRERVAEALALARGAAREAGEGALQARPQTCSYQGGCSYPAICRCER